MSIKYFDINNNVTEASPKNAVRPFKPHEAYCIKDGVQINNDAYDLNTQKTANNIIIKEKRQKRFKDETDALLLEIQAMKILGQNTTAKEQEFTNAYNKIKSDLPLVN